MAREAHRGHLGRPGGLARARGLLPLSATAPEPGLAGASAPIEVPERILVRLPNWVGDVVMATPVLRTLSRAWPGARITVEGRPFLKELVDGLPSVHAFLGDSSKGVGPTWRRSRALAAGRFDLAVLLADSVRSALGPSLARIPRRVGYARDPLRRRLVTDALAPPRDANGQRLPIPMPERYLALTRHLGLPDAGSGVELGVAPADIEQVAQRLSAEGLDGRAPLLLVTPGANFGSSKLYPPESFAQAADGIARATDLVPVFAPGPGEEPLSRRIADAMSSRGVVLDQPVTSLGQLKALVQRASLVLSNDTGPRHMAVALDRPVITLMGPTDPRHTAYQLERQRVLREDVDCSPCHEKTCPIDHRCMTRLSPTRVVQAAQELLS